MKMDERFLMEATCLDPVYVDGMAGVINLGENIAMLFYRWQMVAHGKFEKAPALYLVRPRSSVLLCRPDAACAFRQAMDQDAPTIDQIVSSIASAH